MKHPDKMRKAIGLLLAPLAFAALPASAYTLDVNYWGDFEDREVYEGYDENNTHYFFVLSDDKATGSVVSIEAAESSVTLPEAIKWTSSIEEYDPETDEVNYVTKEKLGRYHRYRVQYGLLLVVHYFP